MWAQSQVCINQSESGIRSEHNNEQLCSALYQDSLLAAIKAQCRLVYNNFLHQLYLTPQKFKPELLDMGFRGRLLCSLYPALHKGEVLLVHEVSARR